MPRRWLSFWSEKTPGTGRTSTSDADIYVPYGQDKLEKARVSAAAGGDDVLLTEATLEEGYTA